MSVEMKPKILDNISYTTSPLGAASDVTVGLTDCHLQDRILNADSDPPVTVPAVGTFTLDGSGLLTIDLTDLIGPYSEAVTALGLKLQWWHILNPQNNSDLVFSDGASNGIALPGGGFTVPGSTVDDTHSAFYWPEVMPNVASGDRTIDVVGGIGEEFQMALVFG